MKHHPLATQVRVERLNARVAQLEREKERLDYERQMAQMYLVSAVGPWSDDGSRPAGCEPGDENCRPPAASRDGGGSSGSGPRISRGGDTSPISPNSPVTSVASSAAGLLRRLLRGGGVGAVCEYMAPRGGDVERVATGIAC